MTCFKEHRNRRLSLFAVLAACLCVYNTIASAQISVNRSVIEFTAKEKVQDIEVFNSGDHKIYLDLKVAEIIDPESAKPTRQLLSDPRTAALIVSPRQLLVPPGERRRLRAILRQPASDKDRVFRLSVRPYTGSVKVNGDQDDKKSSAIKVLVGYDLLLLSRPVNLNPEIRVERNDQHIVFVNEGNTNVLLRRIAQCSASSDECVELQPNRLYAGESYQLALPKKGNADQFPVKVWKSVGLQNDTASY